MRESDVSNKEKLFVLGYPLGEFKYTLKTGSLKNIDDIHTRFYKNRTNLSGNSGGPVVDMNNKVIGVYVIGSTFFATMIKGNILREFVAGDIGLSCEGQVPRACIEEDIRNLKNLAKEGDRIAQYQLANLYLRGIVVEQNTSLAVKWYHRAAVQAHPLAQSNLGAMYFFGYDGVVERNISLGLKWWLRPSSAQVSDCAKSFL